VSALDRYVELLRDYGSRTNLVGSLDRDVIHSDLIEGSLQLLEVAEPSGRLIDVGSGAGIPGIPLAIARPDIEVTLCETRRKRVAFLELVKRRLGLKNVRVDDRDVAELAPGDWDWAVSRAFRPIAGGGDVGRALGGERGRVVCYASKGDWESF